MVSPPDIAAIAEEAKIWRRDIHQHPEILFDVQRTAGAVAEQLRGFGCDEVVTGIGRTGVVGVIHGASGPGRTLALRADMDALPMSEQTNLPYASRNAGKMHACGHDGHTAMLLGAAKALTQARAFAGTVVVVFQPAEEGGGGGRAMVQDGLMERFGVEEVYGMHNLPGLPVGSFSMRSGPIMAAADRFEIHLEGRGGHAAYPQHCIDPVLTGSQIVNNLQTVVSRNMDPLEACVVSVTQFQAGTAQNVIASSAKLGGTVRTLTARNRDLVEERFKVIVTSVARAHGADVEIRYDRGYPVTRNHPEQTALAGRAARAVAGETRVDDAMVPIMGAEDFSYMLEARPGAFIFIGNGDSAGLHNPAYDFDDTAIPHGIAYWTRLVETALR